MTEWVNVHTLGVKGDGGVDDTAAIQRAVDQHRVLYFPGGMYRLTGSIHLRPDSVLIGFSPFTTQFTLLDADPQFQGSGARHPAADAFHAEVKQSSPDSASPREI